MLLGLPAEVWDTVLGIANTALSAAGLVISVLTAITVVIGAAVTVSTYRSDIASKEQIRVATREAGPRSIEVWLEDPFVYVVSRVRDGARSRPVEETDSAPEEWTVHTVTDRPDREWYLATIPDTPEREELLRQLGHVDQKRRSCLVPPWNPTLKVRNYGDRSLRVARVEYDCTTYADTSGEGLEIDLSDPRLALPISTGYAPNSSSTQFWSPQQDDGAVAPFPWMVRSAAESAIRVGPGEDLILTSLREKARDMTGMALLDGLDKQNTPVVVSLALRAFWIVDQTGTYWESRDGSLRELTDGPDWSRESSNAGTP